MKLLLALLIMFPLMSFAQTTTQAQSSEQGSGAAVNVRPLPAPAAGTQPEKQEENKNAVKNDFPIGPFDREGNFNYLFDKKEAGQ